MPVRVMTLLCNVPDPFERSSHHVLSPLLSLATFAYPLRVILHQYTIAPCPSSACILRLSSNLPTDPNILPCTVCGFPFISLAACPHTLDIEVVVPPPIRKDTCLCQYQISPD